MGRSHECSGEGTWLRIEKALILSCLRALILASFCVPMWAHSENVIRGSSCYTYGDSESAKTAREMVRSMALRDALESAGIFLSSESTTRNFSLREDYVRIFSSGTLKNVQVLEHKEEGRKICETIEASLDPASLEEGIKKAAEPAEKGRKISHFHDVLLTSEFASLNKEYRALSGLSPGPGRQEEERRICESIEAGLDPHRVEEDFRKFAEAGAKWGTSFIRVLSTRRDSHFITIKAECLRPYGQTKSIPLDRHPENHIGVTFCNEGRLEKLSVPVCGSRGQIRIFQFQIPEQAVFYSYWVGNYP